jgi:FkbM family methyltransferase
MNNADGDRAASSASAGSAEWLPRNAIAAAINPHLLGLIKIEAQHEVRQLPAPALLAPARLDIMAKYLYALHHAMGTPTAWSAHVYREHLRVWNQFREGDASGKSSFEDYRESFDRLLKSMSEHGFDESMGLLPVDRDNVIIDGAHRLAAALALGLPVKVARFDAHAGRYDQEYFRQRGLDGEVLDDMALQYCRLDASVRVAVLFPVAQGHDEEILGLLQERGTVFYRKAVTVSREGRANLVRLLYRNEAWLGDGTRPTPGLLHHVNNRFIDYAPVKFIFFTAGNDGDNRGAKARIRALFDLGNDSIHINDTHDQTIAVAESVLNANSLHFMNHARAATTGNFSTLLETYKRWIAGNGLDARRFCIDGSAVLSAYGLRDANDLDYLYAGSPAPASPDALIACHNAELAHYDVALNDLVLDPRNHFFWNGVKFVALHRIREMKARRAEPKDGSDVYRIDALEGRVGWAGRMLKWYYTLPERLHSLRYGTLRAVKRIIPAPLLPAARAIYRFPRVARGWIGPEQRKALYRGFELHYSKGTSLMDAIQDGGTYEPEVTHRLVTALRDAGPALFLDIGANIGLITLNVLAELPEARVVAFEPGAHQAGLLEETVTANRLNERVTVFRSALSYQEGTARFAVHRSRHASGDGFFDTRRAGNTQTVEVPVTTLDTWWHGAGQPRVNAMKIDTEGAELWVLQGGEALLASCRPLVVFELHPKNIRVYPHEPIDVLRFFTRRGYTVRTIAGVEITGDNLGQYLESTNDYVAEAGHV